MHNNDIEVHFDYNSYTLIHDFDDKLNNRCPIQIVVDKYGQKWISLLKDIDFKKGQYHNIPRFNLEKCDFVWRLANGSNPSRGPFADGDVIRNPTIEEFVQITNEMKKWKCFFNRKTNEFVAKHQ